MGESVAQFAARIKSKYPDYKDVPDQELTDKILAKHPEYKSQVDLTPTGPSLPPPPTSQVKPAKSPDEQVLDEAPFSKRFAENMNIDMDEADKSTGERVKSGLKEGVLNAAIPGYSGIKMLGGMVKNAGEQLYEGGKEAVEEGRNIKSRKDIIPALTRTGVSAQEHLIKAIPGGEQLWNYGQDIHEGRYSAAAGGAVGMALQAALMHSFGTEPEKMTPRQRVAKLTSAIGGDKEIGAHLEKALPDMDRTVAATGKPPTTPQEFYDLVSQSERNLNTKYGLAVQKVAGKQFVPTHVADALRAKADSLPSVAAEEAKELRKIAAADYEHPRTIADLEKERVWRNEQADAAYKPDIGKQFSTPEFHRMIADALRDVIYDDVLQKQVPGENWRELKMRQRALTKLKGHLRDEVPGLHTKQLSEEGKTMREKLGASASLHGGGITPRAHGLAKIFPQWTGPEVMAGKKITKAFKGKGGLPAPPAAASAPSTSPASPPSAPTPLATPPSSITPPPSSKFQWQHGAHAADVPSIVKEGIKPRAQGQMETPKAFVTTNPKYAMQYPSVPRGGRAVIVGESPKGFMDTGDTHITEEAHTTKTIPPEHIKQIRIYDKTGKLTKILNNKGQEISPSAP